jgi:SPP1 family predicted phage head-tail adaptor
MTRSVDSGRLRHRVIFQQLPADDLVRGSDGEIVEEWVDLFHQPKPTNIRPLSGRELLAANADHHQVTHELTVRFRTEFQTVNALRGVHRGTVYTIHTVIPDADSGRRYQRLLCSTGVRE